MNLNTQFYVRVRRFVDCAYTHSFLSTCMDNGISRSFDQATISAGRELVFDLATSFTSF